MLQQVMTNPGEIIFREVPVPEIKDNQVLVKIMNIGICGSDIHVYHGKHPFNDTATTEIYTLSLHDALPICNRISCGTESNN